MDTFYDRHPECLSMSPEQLAHWLRMHERKVEDEINTVRHEVKYLQWIIADAVKRKYAPAFTGFDEAYLARVLYS